MGQGSAVALLQSVQAACNTSAFSHYHQKVINPLQFPPRELRGKVFLFKLMNG